MARPRDPVRRHSFDRPMLPMTCVMRVPRRLALLVAIAALGVLPVPLSAGDEARQPAVGMTRDVFLMVAAQNQMKVISDVGGVMAVESDDPDVEYERFQFTLAAGVQPGRLWQIVIGYRMPADLARFRRVEQQLTDRYGAPSQSVSKPAEHGEPPLERRVWESGDVVVTLAARPDGETTSDAARMQVVTTDRTLQRLGQAQRRASQPKGN